MSFEYRLPDFTLEIGIIVKQWGVHGAVKVMPSGRQPDRFCGLNRAFLSEKDRVLGAYEIEWVKIMPPAAVIKFSGIDTPEAAESLRNKSVCVAREDAVHLSEMEFFHHDLIGLDVYDLNGCRLGRITGIFENDCNDAYLVKNDEGREELIPAVRDVIKTVDLDQHRMVIDGFSNLFSGDDDAV